MGLRFTSLQNHPDAAAVVVGGGCGYHRQSSSSSSSGGGDGGGVTVTRALQLDFINFLIQIQCSENVMFCRLAPSLFLRRGFYSAGPHSVSNDFIQKVQHSKSPPHFYLRMKAKTVSETR